ncbi:MAG: hypothetical protein MUE41_15990, partial [Gemmatimonadaceae bacterium]|nr:hypothetical protein [Gemmatimonadaceae bacterium]
MSGIRIALGVCLASPALLAAQPASFVYRLGRDTAAIEQFTRTPTEVAGEMVQRTGTTVARYRYRVTVGRTGRPTAASIRRLQPDGSDVPTGVRETRFTVTRDSIVRELVFADSVQRRAFAATDAMINFPTFIYGPTELLHALRTKRQPTDSLPALGAQGAMNHTGFTALGGDTLRLRGGPYAMLLRFDAQSRLLSLDGTNTTNKVLATRGAGGLDLQALAMAMAPTGVLSARETVRAAFGPGGIVIV